MFIFNKSEAHPWSFDPYRLPRISSDIRDVKNSNPSYSFSDVSLVVEHSHASHSYIVEHLNELVTQNSEQSTREKVQRLFKETKCCLEMIEGSYPKDSTHENARLRKGIKETIAKDEDVVRFLEALLSQLAVKQAEKAQSKRSGKFFTKVRNSVAIYPECR